jgi:hemin uptake protein HemP
MSFEKPPKGAENPIHGSAFGSKVSVPRYDVAKLLCGGREAILEHSGAEYLLRITASGRLILTK